MDKVTYERVNGRNQLKLIKHLPVAKVSADVE